jgi:hypothetical protein
MREFFLRILGLGTPAGERLAEGRLFFVRAWPLWLAVLAVAGIVAWTVFFYNREGERARAIQRAVMAGLRVAAILVLLLVFFQPMLALSREETTQSVVALLIDRSRSMGIHDRWQSDEARQRMVRAVGAADGDRLSRAEALDRILRRPDVNLVRRLRQRHQVRAYGFGSDVRALTGEVAGTLAQDASPSATEPATAVQSTAPPATLDKPDPALAEATKLGEALDRTLSDMAGQPAAGIVLFSDGAHNLGEDPVAVARKAAARGVPIYTVGLGESQPPRDLAITSMLVDDVVRKGDEVTVSVALKQRGYDGHSVPLTLRQDGRVLAQTTLRFKPGSTRQEAALTFTPMIPGQYTLSVAVPVQPDELSHTNNTREVPIRVVDKKLRILYLESGPRWEYRYLKNAILRDPTIQFSCMLLDSDASLGGEGNVPIYGFPTNRDDLFKFDIVILGDVAREHISLTQLQVLKAFVQDRGGSLVVIAGERAMPWEYRGTPLEELLPVVLPDQREDFVTEEPFRPMLTAAGRKHPMMLIADRPEASAALWAQLPGMYWCGVVPRAKPGATVLAVHPTRSNADGKLPLMATQKTGEGTCFLSLVDSTWLWRYRRGDKYFYRFWGQVLRSMTPHELPGENRFAKLTTDRTTYALGEPIVLRARLLTSSFHPVRDPSVPVEVVRDDGTVLAVKLQSVPGTPGIYEAEWLPQRPGRYRASIRPTGGTTRVSTQFAVEESQLEYESPEQNRALLKQVAAISGGAYVQPDEVAKLPERIRDRSTVTRSRVEHELWDTPLPLALFTLFIVGEWVLRKRRGLL